MSELNDLLTTRELQRWRLILGEAAETTLCGLDDNARQIDHALEWLYGRDPERLQRCSSRVVRRSFSSDMENSPVLQRCQCLLFELLMMCNGLWWTMQRHLQRRNGKLRQLIMLKHLMRQRPAFSWW